MSNRRTSPSSAKRIAKPTAVPMRIANPDDILTPQEEALMTKARGQLRRGEGVKLADLDHVLKGGRIILG